jgi:hypothetical protein
MSEKPIQLESYHLHTGLTKAEVALLLNEDLSNFITICIEQLIDKEVITNKSGTLTILEPFSTYLKQESNESVLLIKFAKKQVVLFAYEIPLLKLMLSPIHLNIIFKKAQIIQKVFYDWIEYRLIGFDVIATKEFYLNEIKKDIPDNIA